MSRIKDKVYEYIEVISGDIIKTEIFEVDGESRILVDTITTKIEASGDQLEITQSDTDIDYFKDFSLENNDPISDNSVMFSTQSLSGFWKNTWVKMSYKKDYKKKMGYARFTRSEKKVKLPSKPFDNYAKQVDNLVSIQQGALLSIGPIGMIESLVGFLSHKKLTPAVVKQAIKKFGGKIPGIGTIYSLINYVYTYDKAVKAFNKIPGNAYWWKWIKINIRKIQEEPS